MSEAVPIRRRTLTDERQKQKDHRCLTDKPFRKGQKVDLYVQLDHLNYIDEDGERISDDEPVNDHVYPATLTFRPRGCFLSEAELHNDEKCYKTIRSVRLGKKTLLHLEGAETKQKLLYLVDSSDLIYSSLPIYMRKKRKKRGRGCLKT